MPQHYSIVRQARHSYIAIEQWSLFLRLSISLITLHDGAIKVSSVKHAYRNLHRLPIVT